MATAGKDDKLKVVYMGKEYLITPDEHGKLVDQVFKRLDNYIKSLISTNTQNQKTLLEYKESAEIRNGFFDAITPGGGRQGGPGGLCR